MFEEPVAVAITPRGQGAIAVVLLQGGSPIERIQSRLLVSQARSRSDPWEPGRPRVVRWGGPGGEELVACHTDRETLELHCHGGVAVVDRVLADLASLGFHVVPWKTWRLQTARDPIEAEAEIALAHALTERTAAILLDQLGGALRRCVEGIQRHLVDDPALAGSELEMLLASSRLGLHLTHPFHVVLTGRANAGKSTLFNALLGYERVLVDSSPGTTRDAVQATIALDGWPMTLVDTAGFTSSHDPLEREAMQVARRQIAEADLVLLLVDGSTPWQKDETDLVAGCARAYLCVFTKCDLGLRDAPRRGGIGVSAVTGSGLDALRRAVLRSLVPQVPARDAPIAFTARQTEHLRRARDHLVRCAREGALRELRRLRGGPIRPGEA